MIRVRAKFPNDNDFGFYDTKRRRNGDEFNIKDETEFSEIWMEKLSTIGRPKKSEAVI